MLIINDSVKREIRNNSFQIPALSGAGILKRGTGGGK